MTVCLVLGALALLIWVGIALHPARPWDFRLIGDTPTAQVEPVRWPSVRVLVPARNEAYILPETLPSLLNQDYPGRFGITVIDDRSDDGTARLATAIAERANARDQLHVVSGRALPAGWVGKMWALQQGVESCGFGPGGSKDMPDYLLLTDADIWHAPCVLRHLVAESEAGRLGLNSRLALLRCASPAERLLIPPFVFFFGLLYPMRWVNVPTKKTAAAAGGCVLLASRALLRIGGFHALRDRIIDDVNLARLVKTSGLSIRLSLSRVEVRSLRAYDRLAGVWRTVRRSAFTQLGHSWLRLLATLLGMTVAFAAPPVLLLVGLLSVRHGPVDALYVYQPAGLLTLVAGLAWGTMARVYLPAVRFFGLPHCWSLTLPGAALVYQAMTLDSALRSVTTERVDWR